VTYAEKPTTPPWHVHVGKRWFERCLGGFWTHRLAQVYAQEIGEGIVVQSVIPSAECRPAEGRPRPDAQAKTEIV
jgi:hypothetical protein